MYINSMVIFYVLHYLIENIGVLRNIGSTQTTNIFVKDKEDRPLLVKEKRCLSQLGVCYAKSCNYEYTNYTDFGLKPIQGSEDSTQSWWSRG